MMFFPTTRVDVWRDQDTSDVDVFGDETETGTEPVATDVPASLAQTSVSRRLAADLSQDRVASYMLRVASVVGVREGDRIVDRRGSGTYQVTTGTDAPSPAGVVTVAYVCSRVGPA